MVRYTYDAWGNHTVRTNDGTEIAEATHIGNINPIRYRGYYYDTEIGLYYLQTRYYDPTTGRFVTIDGIAYADPESINGLNLYAYCGNNPVMNVDPTGHLFWLLFIGFAIGFVISGVVEVGKQIAENGWNPTQWDWKQIGLSALGGGVAGLISAIPLGGAIGAFVFGGIGSVVGGLISGTVDSLESGIFAFTIGAFANILGYGVTKVIEKVRVNGILKLSSKAKSIKIWELKGVNSSTLSKQVKYIFKKYTFDQVLKVVRNADFWLKNNIYSAIISSILSNWS